METTYTVVEVWPGIALLAVFTILALLIRAGVRGSAR